MLDLVTTVTERRASRAAVQPMPEQIAHFELVRELGRGGMGVVYDARDLVLGRHVALKLVRVQRSLAETARACHAREAQALSRLVHPNIVQIFEAGVAGTEPYIAMELVEGPTLQRWLYEVRDWQAIVDVFIAVGRALASVHELGLVHRDVKPSNIFIDRDGTPKLGDFGLVTTLHALGTREITPIREGEIVGTPAYMAPEQRLGLPAHPRADQYAFCAALYEALTGSLPANGISSMALPRRLHPIIARGLAPAPEARWPTLRALVGELEAVRRGRVKRIADAIAMVVGGR